MIPTQELVKAKTIAEAHRHLEIYDDFNLIPIETEDQITGYVERGDDQLKPINIDGVMGNGCSILDLVDVLADKQFCFVTGKCGVEGFIHFSDLNHSLVDLPFFILLQSVETCVVSLIQDKFNEATLCHVFEGDYKDIVGKDFAKNVIGRWNKNKATNANRNLLNEINLDNMLRFAYYYRMLDLSEEKICELYAVRNSLSHVPERLINSHDDVSRLKRTKNQCYKILSSHLPELRHG